MRCFALLLFFLFALSASVTQAQTPCSAGDYLHRGTARFAKGDLEGAIADYNKAIAINPRFAAAYKNRGLVRLLQGQDAEAEKDFDEYLASEKEIEPELEQLIRAARLQHARRLARSSGDYNAGGQER
jgi:tetratricopeptide (TPR) repeat protein